MKDRKITHNLQITIALKEISFSIPLVHKLCEAPSLSLQTTTRTGRLTKHGCPGKFQFQTINVECLSIQDLGQA